MKTKAERQQDWAMNESKKFISADKVASKAARMSREDLKKVAAKHPELAKDCETALTDNAVRAAMYDRMIADQRERDELERAAEEELERAAKAK